MAVYLNVGFVAVFCVANLVAAHQPKGVDHDKDISIAVGTGGFFRSLSGEPSKTARPGRHLRREDVATTEPEIPSLTHVPAGSIIELDDLTQPSSFFSDAAAVSDAEDAALGSESVTSDCWKYVAQNSCDWTLEFSCPGQPRGSKGERQEDTSDSYTCCCKAGLWRNPLNVAVASAPEKMPYQARGFAAPEGEESPGRIQIEVYEAPELEKDIRRRRSYERPDGVVHMNILDNDIDSRIPRYAKDKIVAGQSKEKGRGKPKHLPTLDESESEKYRDSGPLKFPVEEEFQADPKDFSRKGETKSLLHFGTFVATKHDFLDSAYTDVSARGWAKVQAGTVLQGLVLKDNRLNVAYFTNLRDDSFEGQKFSVTHNTRYANFECHGEPIKLKGAGLMQCPRGYYMSGAYSRCAANAVQPTACFEAKENFQCNGMPVKVNSEHNMNTPFRLSFTLTTASTQNGTGRIFSTSGANGEILQLSWTIDQKFALRLCASPEGAGCFDEKKTTATMMKGQTYDMVFQWGGTQANWTVDGTVVAHWDSSTGFGKTLPALCVLDDTAVATDKWTGVISNYKFKEAWHNCIDQNITNPDQVNQNLDCIQELFCCKPSGVAEDWGHCEPWESAMVQNEQGLNSAVCASKTQAVVGIYREACNSPSCIKGLKCCSPPAVGQCKRCPWHMQRRRDRSNYCRRERCTIFECCEQANSRRASSSQVLSTPPGSPAGAAVGQAVGRPQPNHAPSASPGPGGSSSAAGAFVVPIEKAVPQMPESDLQYIMVGKNPPMTVPGSLAISGTLELAIEGDIELFVLEKSRVTKALQSSIGKALPLPAWDGVTSDTFHASWVKINNITEVEAVNSSSPKSPADGHVLVLYTLAVPKFLISDITPTKIATNLQSEESLNYLQDALIEEGMSPRVGMITAPLPHPDNLNVATKSRYRRKKKKTGGDEEETGEGKGKGKGKEEEEEEAKAPRSPGAARTSTPKARPKSGAKSTFNSHYGGKSVRGFAAPSKQKVLPKPKSLPSRRPPTSSSSGVGVADRSPSPSVRRSPTSSSPFSPTTRQSTREASGEQQPILVRSESSLPGKRLKEWDPKLRFKTLQQCADHCMNAGSIYFQFGIKDTARDGNCACAESTESPSLVPNEKWNVYKASPRWTGAKAAPDKWAKQAASARANFVHPTSEPTARPTPPPSSRPTTSPTRYPTPRATPEPTDRAGVAHPHPTPPPTPPPTPFWTPAPTSRSDKFRQYERLSASCREGAVKMAGSHEDKSHSDCKTACDEASGCVAFNRDFRTRTCNLYSKCPGERGECVESTCGYRLAREYEQLLDRCGGDGEDVISSDNIVSSVAECQARCDWRSECSAFDFDSDGFKCSLYKTCAGPVGACAGMCGYKLVRCAVPGADSTKWESGSKTCVGSQDCLNSNDPYPTLASAWDACGSTARCALISHSDGKFYLRTGDEPDSHVGQMLSYACQAALPKQDEKEEIAEEKQRKRRKKEDKSLKDKDAIIVKDDQAEEAKETEDESLKAKSVASTESATSEKETESEAGEKVRIEKTRQQQMERAKIRAESKSSEATKQKMSFCIILLAMLSIIIVGLLILSKKQTHDATDAKKKEMSIADEYVSFEFEVHGVDYLRVMNEAEFRKMLRGAIKDGVELLIGEKSITGDEVDVQFTLLPGKAELAPETGNLPEDGDIEQSEVAAKSSKRRSTMTMKTTTTSGSEAPRRVIHLRRFKAKVRVYNPTVGFNMKVVADKINEYSTNHDDFTESLLRGFNGYRYLHANITVHEFAEATVTSTSTETVSFSFTIANMELDEAQQNIVFGKGLTYGKQPLVDQIQAAIAKEFAAKGVMGEHITINLRAGSVVVDVTIQSSQKAQLSVRDLANLINSPDAKLFNRIRDLKDIETPEIEEFTTARPADAFPPAPTDSVEALPKWDPNLFYSYGAFAFKDTNKETIGISFLKASQASGEQLGFKGYRDYDASQATTELSWQPVRSKDLMNDDVGQMAWVQAEEGNGCGFAFKLATGRTLLFEMGKADVVEVSPDESAAVATIVRCLSVLGTTAPFTEIGAGMTSLSQHSQYSAPAGIPFAAEVCKKFNAPALATTFEWMYPDVPETLYVFSRSFGKVTTFELEPGEETTDCLPKWTDGDKYIYSVTEGKQPGKWAIGNLSAGEGLDVQSTVCTIDHGLAMPHAVPFVQWMRFNSILKKFEVDPSVVVAATEAVAAGVAEVSAIPEDGIED